MMDSLIKITDRTEILLPLDRYRVYEIVRVFREYCLNKYKDIFPKGFDKEKIDERFGFPKVHPDKMEEYRNNVLQYLGYDTKSYKPIDCVVELLRNPRTLKRSLAHTWSAWQILHGEIYFDDLLIIHAIRVIAPNLYEILATQIRVFRLFVNPKTTHKNTKLYEDIEFTLKEQNIDTRVYHQLIRFLFPAWEIPDDEHADQLTNRMFSETVHPQGIAQSEPSDYFYRLTSEDVAGDDQNTMKDILDYNEGNVSEDVLMERMINDAQYSKRVEHFGKLIDPDKVLSLTSVYFNTLKYDYRRFADYVLTGQLWRIHLKNSADENFHQTWLEDVLSTYLPVSIRFANDIFYFWKYRKDSEAESKYVRPEIEQMYKQLIRNIFEDAPKKLINALESEPAYIWTLRHLLFRNIDNDQIKSCDQKETIFSDWKPWFIDLLIAASIINPKLVAMFVVPLLYDIKMTTIDDIDTEDGMPRTRQGWKAVYDETVASLLFGDRFPIARKMISDLSEDDYSKYNFDEQAKCILDSAISDSKKWSERQSSDQKS